MAKKVIKEPTTQEEYNSFWLNARNKVVRIAGWLFIGFIFTANQGMASKGYQTYLGNMTDVQKDTAGVLFAAIGMVIVLYGIKELKK